MKVVWVGNAHLQATGYGRLCKHIARHVHDHSDHTMVEFAISGLNHCEPFDWDGIMVYSATQHGGKFGINDWAVVQSLEKPDLWLLNFDAWSGAQPVAKSALRYALYPPIDHDPLSPLWTDLLAGAVDIIPYCKFADRVIRQGIGDVYPISDPIYHGVDVRVMKPRQTLKAEVFGQPVEQDDFVVGIFKNNQGTRAKYEVNLKAFAMFLERTGDDRARLYLHCNQTGASAFNVAELVKHFGLSGKVFMPHADLIRYGVDHAEMSRFYNACDVILNTNSGEGFGLPILEAFACGKPVIASGYSSMPELLGLTEGTRMRSTVLGEPDVIDAPRGWVVPMLGEEWTLGKQSSRFTFDPVDVAEALVRAHKSKSTRSAIGKDARDWAKLFSWETIGDQWIQKFDEIERRMKPKKVTWASKADQPNKGDPRESELGLNTVAGCLFSFNRPEYLASTVTSLVENARADDVDWFLRQDGCENQELPYATEEHVEMNRELVAQCTKILRVAPFKAATLSRSKLNWCIAHQVRDAMKDVFDARGYQAAMFFDDDHVVSRDYVDVLLRLHEQFPDAIVGAQATEARHIPADAKCNEVGITLIQTPDSTPRPGRWRWLGYLMPREAYKQIKDDFDEYLEFVGPSHWNIPHRAVCAKYGVHISGYDGVLDRFCDLKGIRRVATVIPRARYIGKVGMFGNERLYRHMGFKDTLQYEFDESKVAKFVERGAVICEA